jgi:hypothetical protein
MAGRDGAVAGACCGRAVPDHSAGDAVVNEEDRLLRRAFEVERLRQAARVDRIVADRDLLVGDALADPVAQIAAFLQQPECAERVV